MITYRMFLLVILAMVGLPASADAEQPPNILVVLLDDAGFMDFGVYGSDTKTPTIDRVRQQGVMFSRYYTSPMCGPSRAMLMTGQDNHMVGMGTLVETLTPEMRDLPGYSMVWDDDQPTIASRLQAAGYQTFVTGKWGIGKVGENLPGEFGFDRSYVMDATGGSNYSNRSYLPSKAEAKWYEDDQPIELPDDYYSSRSLVDKMIAYLGEADKNRPFFAFLSMQALHIPVQVPKEWIDKYNGVFDRGWDVMREERLQKAMDLGLVPEGTELAPAPDHHRAWESLSEDEKAYWARVMQVNAGMMEAADYHTGRLLDFLEQSGGLDNTLVIITSDNGAESAVMAQAEGPAGALIRFWMFHDGWNADIEKLGEPLNLTAIGPEWASVSVAPFRHYKFNASEGGMRVPLVMAGPGIEPSGLQNGRAHVTDLAPTILAAAGVAYDETQFDGRSLMPILAGQTDRVYEEDEVVGFEASGTGAIYRGDWKITRIPPPQGDGEWKLYNLAQDPGETNDLSATNPALFQEMLAEYQRYATDVGIYELPPGESARSQLNKNQFLASAKRFWPISLLLIVLGLGILVMPLYIVRRRLRRRQQ